MTCTVLGVDGSSDQVTIEISIFGQKKLLTLPADQVKGVPTGFVTAELTDGTQVVITRGPDCGLGGEMLRTDGDTAILQRWDADRTEIPAAIGDLRIDPHGELRRRVEADHERWLHEEIHSFWDAKVGTPEDDLLVEWASFEAHQAGVEKRARARLLRIMSEFDAVADGHDLVSLCQTLEADEARWFPMKVAGDERKARWKADDKIYLSETAATEARRERWLRAGDAVFRARQAGSTQWSAR